MDIHLGQRAREVKPFLAMEIMERATALQAQGRDIIYLCLGEPDFPTPSAVVAAAEAAMKAGETSYTHSLGTPELRSEIAAYYRRRYQVEISPDQILVSSGTSPLMLLLFATLLDQGDEIILADPGYACYSNFIRFQGGKTVFVPAAEEDGFQPRPAEIRQRISPRTRGILVNSPSNPAGSLLPVEWMRELAALPVPVISDEIYHGLTYEGEERSILEFTPEAFVLGGFSKAYAMTGWRLGYLIAPSSAVRTLQSLHQNFLICANSFVQTAGIAALRGCDADVAEMRRAYDVRRRYIVKRIAGLGLGVRRMPAGAFYVLADARHISGDSLALGREILDATGVAVTPGIDFGSGAEGFLRFSYSNSLERIAAACDRLEDFFRSQGYLS